MATSAPGVKFLSPPKGDKRFGARKMSCELGTGALSASGSSPRRSACTIVDEFNTIWAVRSFIDFEAVKKKLENKDTLRSISECRSVDGLLKALGLTGLQELADWNHLKASNWVKGHLLAEKLGGKGESSNLMPLDRSANGEHGKFEADILAKLKRAQAAEKRSDYYIVIRYDVEGSGKLKPWFKATAETRKLLENLPEKLKCRVSTKCFVPKDGKGKSITDSKKARIPNIKAKKTISLGEA